MPADQPSGLLELEREEVDDEILERPFRRPTRPVDLPRLDAGGRPRTSHVDGKAGRMTAAREGSEPGLVVGPTSEFSLFFRVKPGEGDPLRAALRDLQDTPGYRPGDYEVAISTIHEARFVLFDDDTRLAFMTSFDGPWDAYMEDFFTSGPTLELFDVVFRHTEGYDGLPDLAAVKGFVMSAQQTAAAYARNYGGTVKEVRKAQRVNAAFQQVLDHPDAAAALQHPALRPLLGEAAD
jgi:hypothetical protein